MHLDEVLRAALQEDLGTRGDITTDAVVPSDLEGRAVIRAREDGVAAGVGVAARVFLLLDRELEIVSRMSCGTNFHRGDVLLEVAGRVRPILTGERTALNFLGRLCGIAAAARRMTEAVSHTRAKVVDTRKTTPGLRMLEKAAVAAGGACNHRYGLYDAVMIKDNHIVAAGSLREAVRRVRERVGHMVKLEVEDLEGLKEALEAGVDVVLLDNMPVERMAEAVRMVGGEVILEASGGIGMHNIAEVAETGVDFISCGALTHSARSIDLSLELSVGSRPNRRPL